jgi:hypothetical protein
MRRDIGLIRFWNLYRDQPHTRHLRPRRVLFAPSQSTATNDQETRVRTGGGATHA